MDRWSIDCIYKHLFKETKKMYPDINLPYDNYSVDYIGYYHGISSRDFVPQCCDNFLTAIILWDEIWSFHQEFTFHKEIINNHQKEHTSKEKIALWQEPESNLGMRVVVRR